MIDQTMISFILIFMVAPLAFVLWAVCSSVNALTRIARPTETLVDQQMGYTDASYRKRDYSSAYAYVPKQAETSLVKRPALYTQN